MLGNYVSIVISIAVAIVTVIAVIVVIIIDVVQIRGGATAGQARANVLVKKLLFWPQGCQNFCPACHKSPSALVTCMNALPKTWLQKMSDTNH